MTFLLPDVNQNKLEKAVTNCNLLSGMYNADCPVPTMGHVTSQTMWPTDSPYDIGGPLEPSLYLQPFSRYSVHHMLMSTLTNAQQTWRTTITSSGGNKIFFSVVIRIIIIDFYH